MPVVVPRTGFTILDQHSEKLMGRYGLSLPDFFAGEDALRERIAASLVPPALHTALGRDWQAVDQRHRTAARGSGRVRPHARPARSTAANARSRYQLSQDRRQGRARSHAAQRSRHCATRRHFTA